MKLVQAAIAFAFFIFHVFIVQAEVEPNNDFKSANSITLPDTMHGTIQVIGDQDYFKLIVPQGGVLLLTVTNVPNNLEMVISLFEADTTLQVQSVTGSAGINVYMESVIPAGTYYIRLNDDNNNEKNNGVYKLMVNLYTGDGFEYNNTFSAAATIPTDTSFQAQIRGLNYQNTEPNDWDFYKVNTSSDGVLEIEISDGPQYLEMQVSVFAESDTTTLIGYAAAPQASLARLDVVIPAGTYYVKVNEQNDNETSPDPYTFTISLDTTDACEYNNSFSTACLVSQNSSFPAKINGMHLTNPVYNDQDFYKVQTSKGGVLAVQIDSVPQYLEMQVTVYQEADTINPTATITGTQGETTPLAQILPAGVYFIKVNDQNNNESSPDAYNVTISLDTTETCEYNNVFATACQLLFCDTIGAEIYPAGDIDYYSFAGNGLPVTAKAASVPADISMKITLYDATQTQIGLPVQGSLGQPASIVTNTIDGAVYFAKVEAVGASKNPYQFVAGDTTCFLATSVHEMAAEPAIGVYPNPTNGDFILSWTSGTSMKFVSIYDVSGQQLMKSSISANADHEEFDIRSWSPGIYFLRWETENGKSGRPVKVIRTE